MSVPSFPDPSFFNIHVPPNHVCPEDLAAGFFTFGSAQTLAAAGSAQGDAAAVTYHGTNVTGADGAVGVRLPVCVKGLTYTVFNNGASALLVYPDTGSQIARASANAALSVAAGVAVMFVRLSPTVWVPLGLGSVTQSSAGDFAVGGNLTVTGDVVVSGGDIDLGASGAAGSVDIFPTTAAKGKLHVTAGDAAGNTTTTLTTASQATTRTYTIPDALADGDTLIGSQAAVARTATVTGATTGTIADKGVSQHVTVTAGGDANSIVILPTPTPGTRVTLFVGATGYELRSSTPASIAINGGTGANAESAIPANTTVYMLCVSATAWLGYQQNSAGALSAVEVAAP